jgi:hypothetical protein
MAAAEDPDDMHPEWYCEALRAAHLRFGGAAQSPGRMEEAAVRAIEEAARAVREDPGSRPTLTGMFRHFAGPDAPLTARRMLGSVLRQVAEGHDAARYQRGAAVLALVVLVVLEDQDPEQERLRRNAKLQGSKAGWGRIERTEDGKEIVRPWGPVSTRDDLVELLQPGSLDVEPAISELARDVRDGVKPTEDVSAFLAEHRDLVVMCAAVREKHEAWTRGLRFLRSARLHSFCTMAGFVGQPLVKWRSEANPIELAVGKVIAEILEQQEVPPYLGAGFPDPPAGSLASHSDEVEDEMKTTGARFELLRAIWRAACEKCLAPATIVRLLAAGGGLAALLLAESSDSAPLQFLGAAREHPEAPRELRWFLRQVEEQLLTADTDEGRQKITSELWRVVESGGPAGRVDVSETAVEPLGQTTDEAAPTVSKRPGAGDAVPRLPRFTGSGVSWRQAVDMLDWNISPEGLRKKAEAAPENDPLHVLGAEGPGRIPGKARNYLRSDAVGWVKLQCHAVISAELEEARAEKRATASPRLSDSAVRKLSRIIR